MVIYYVVGRHENDRDTLRNPCENFVAVSFLLFPIFLSFSVFLPRWSIIIVRRKKEKE